VTAYHGSTLRALPLYLFLFQKLPDTLLLNIFKVLNHAHPVKSAVALVDTLQPLAWKIPAFIAVLYPTAQKIITSLFQEGAFLVSGPAADAVRHPDSLAL